LGAGQTRVDTGRAPAFIGAIVTRTVLALCCLGACASALTAAPAPPFRHQPLNVANGCLVESIYFYDRFRERFGADAWVRVLQWGAKEEDEVVAGHAVAVFVYQDRLWAWDINYGYLPLDLSPAHRADVDRVLALILRKYPGIEARYPIYRFDFPQEPDADPPAARLLDEDAAVRDASVVAAKLAAHRPVNLVRFSYVKDGVTRRGAAAVFLFHGRYCVYTPDQGTVPFLAQGSVRNLRLIQQALRRIHPGAFAVQSLGGD
jgi:hypothetical protein